MALAFTNNPCPWSCPICGRLCSTGRKGHAGSHQCVHHSNATFKAWEEYLALISEELAMALDNQPTES